MNKKIKFIDRIYNKPITCLTAYSGSVAKILDGNVDMILIGDSLGSTLYNMKNTQGVTLEMMKMHGKAVTTNVKKYNLSSIISYPGDLLCSLTKLTKLMVI